MLSVASHVYSALPSTAQFSDRLKENNQEDGKDSSNGSKGNTKVDASTELANQKQLQSLKARDREVRAHELAHASVGGQFTSAPSFTYQKGSDGVLYAVGGEVSISSSAVAGDPRATLEKAQIIQRAALAPADPSSQDRSVAANAAAMAQKARIDLAKLLQIENTREVKDNSDNGANEKKSIDIFA